MKASKLEEIKALCELELSILNDGKIEPDEDGFMVSKKDQHRTEKLHELMTKHTYGWYIAMETIEEQILSLNRFKDFILMSV